MIAHKDYDVRGGGEMLAETLADGLGVPVAGYLSYRAGQAVARQAREVRADG
ncbi:MAG: hypothetical protein V5A22_07305 [Salinivenus sp.]